MKKTIEKWAVNKLYLLDFHKFGRISRHRKKIIFDFCGGAVWFMFPSFKKWLPFYVLCNLCGWGLYEAKVDFWCRPYKPRLNHTWGEV